MREEARASLGKTTREPNVPTGHEPGSVAGAEPLGSSGRRSRGSLPAEAIQQRGRGKSLVIGRFVCAVCASAILTGSAGAGGAAIPPAGYWTPRQAAHVLLLPHPKVAWIERKARGPALRHPADEFGRAARVKEIACRGLGTVHARAYPAFRCTMTYAEAPARAITTIGLYARIWSTSAACISAVTLADCPPPPKGPPLFGDPRCSISSSICMASSAIAKTADALRAERAAVPTIGCFALTAFVYGCIWDGGHGSSTVRFVQGKSRWTIVVHIAPPPSG
jgi:hypothetical protein